MDYQNGEVVSVEEDEQFAKEPDVAEESFDEIVVRGKEIDLKPVFKILSLVFGFLLCIYLFNHIYVGMVGTSKVFGFLNSYYLSTSVYNQAYVDAQKEKQATEGINAFHPLDFDGKEEYKTSQENARALMSSITKYNQNLMSHYQTLKNSILSYSRGQSSYYLMNSSLKSIKKSVSSDYANLLKVEFADPEIKMLFVSRYKMLLAFLSSHTDNFTASKLLVDVNALIAEDNVYNLKEYELLKKYLTDQGIHYVYENNKIKID